eukprot:CAMPEP_0202906492 /NCGR_PEP_ID=MMETSP1392-20130828/39142_1 /ASSEMBLY_ACC=CAM_ASM_000868 /TAXON_ID=225041 /ORGANISM="Chlamydomonas chlamydogama, Strain SAG 11-48b" /LENGTH=144 /DNA_ID=CAMNT_0049595029 /DNA_START=250 /DNA_END=684 /DNA_ORIENTATION=+
MREVGEMMLRRSSAPGAKLKFGYHVPPFRSVDHLHLHCFELPHEPAWKEWKYRLPHVWLDSSSLIRQLQEEKQQLSGDWVPEQHAHGAGPGAGAAPVGTAQGFAASTSMVSEGIKVGGKVGGGAADQSSDAGLREPLNGLSERL